MSFVESEVLESRGESIRPVGAFAAPDLTPCVSRWALSQRSAYAPEMDGCRLGSRSRAQRNKQNTSGAGWPDDAGGAGGTLQRVLTNRRPEFKGAFDGPTSVWDSARPLRACIQNRLDHAAVVLPEIETVVLVQGPD